MRESIVELKNLQSSGAALNDQLRAELNQLGKGIRSHVLVVHNATYVGSPLDDAELVLSQLPDLRSYGKIRAFRRGRRAPNSKVNPILAITFSSELATMRVLDAYAVYRRDYLAQHGGSRPPFRIDRDMPKAVVEEINRINKIVAFWRTKGLGDYRRHGEKIVLFINNRFSTDIEIPKGLLASGWGDPLPAKPPLNKRAAPTEAEGRESVYERSLAASQALASRRRSPSGSPGDGSIQRAQAKYDNMLQAAAAKAQAKSVKRPHVQFAQATPSSSSSGKVTILPPRTVDNFMETFSQGRLRPAIEDTIMNDVTEDEDGDIFTPGNSQTAALVLPITSQAPAPVTTGSPAAVGREAADSQGPLNYDF